MKLGRFDQVSRWLREAAAYPRSFYGQLALEALGADAPFNFEQPPLPRTALTRIRNDAAGRRALALLQIGEDHRADTELRKLWTRSSPETRAGMLALATRTGMASLALRLGGIEARNGQLNDLALWPVPGWEPVTGFRVDRALLYALMRQESAFQPRAKSPVGARGLMQVMPQTAMFVARDSNLRNVSRRTLYNPELNMSLGQGYIEYLLETRHIDNTLLHVVAAYNAGPANVQKWDRVDRHGGDPLLFVESVSFRESRDYIKKVLANLWMYRHRLGQSSPSLTAVAGHQWPRYEPQDGRPRSVAARPLTN